MTAMLLGVLAVAAGTEVLTFVSTYCTGVHNDAITAFGPEPNGETWLPLAPPPPSIGSWRRGVHGRRGRQLALGHSRGCSSGASLPTGSHRPTGADKGQAHSSVVSELEHHLASCNPQASPQLMEFKHQTHRPQGPIQDGSPQPRFD